MKYSSTISALGLSVVVAACSQESTSPPAQQQAPGTPPAVAENPLFNASTLPHGLPPFDLITSDHFAAAIERGMAINTEEINTIASNPERPTFDNTIAALELAGQDLDRVLRVYYNLSGANTDDTLQAVQREMAPRLAAHNDSISLNPQLFARLDRLYQQREELGLDPESLRALERYHSDFVRSGAMLAESQQARLREINAELARLSTLFSQHVLAEVNDSAVLVDTAAELEGLSAAEIQSTATAATAQGHDGKYLIALLNTSDQPPLSSLSNRALRERIHTTSTARGSRGNEFDTTGIVTDTLRLRAERAQMLGYATHAHFTLENQTASTPDAVNEMLGGIAPVAVANARAEGEAIQALINATEAEPFELAAWDWSFYAEKVRRERYAFDEAEVRPYFEMNSVLVNGVYFAAEQIYGLAFTLRPDLPTYHPDVQVWEVTDADGSSLGLVLTDFYARSSKRGGAWMNSYNVQAGLTGGSKVIALHLNVPKPPEGEPTLLTFAEVTTAFHEFGHVLHGLFSDVQYPRFAGTSVPRDFVEFPSQVNEMWASWPEVLENYARHHETGERIPQELLDRVLAAEQFNQGFGTTEYLAASIVDMALHQLSPEQIPAAPDLLAFEAQVLRDNALDYAPVPPRYRVPYFSHIMGGYAAGYYSYIWSEVLDADTVQWFKDNGGMRRENGQHFRDTLLSKGGSRDAMALFEDFAGRAPDSSHMLRRRGLLVN
ncbi:MAG: dipeptidyl carboxypeptidase II [Gammaproteobacteria bacterium RIFCSPLOWO2_02_FULL_57_10]|nr:MAG: dipeptidyl carboxypeptidase II [Gammaproteobacteria bacterium RIFCSPLOWO2_02_FULL_57_10]